MSLLPPQILPANIAPPALLPAAAECFGQRAARLRHLAEGHSMAAWLGWLAELSDAQQEALTRQADLGLRLGKEIDLHNPLLHAGQTLLRDAWPAVYRSLAERLGFPPLADKALAQRADANLALAAGRQTADGRDLNDVLVAAALQVAWTAAARRLGLTAGHRLASVAENCPCCGSAAVGSIVLRGDGSAGLRYLECSLCTTRWNAVRARCTLCDEGSIVDYLGLAETSGAVQAETCDFCHGYIKTFFQNKDVLVDPVADDLATLALDVLVGEQGYARALPNLFLCEGEAA